jgi:hypothetical protein
VAVEGEDVEPIHIGGERRGHVEDDHRVLALLPGQHVLETAPQTTMIRITMVKLPLKRFDYDEITQIITSSR